VAAARPATISGSLRSATGDAGSSRPSLLCTTLIEFSTVTKAGPLGLRSTSVRPRHGKSSAVSAVSTWLRFSFVAICTLSSAFASAAFMRSVSGPAATRLPPSATSTFTSPRSSASIVPTTSSPCARGERMPNGAIEPREEVFARRFVDAHRAIALHVAVPTHGAGAGAWAADVAAQQQEVHELAHVGDAVLVLREPHGPARDRALVRA
jgi:hypothetical protein